MAFTHESGLNAPEPNRFGRALFIAAVIEIIGITSIIYISHPQPVVAPETVQLKILAPAPAPVAAKPPPPVPQPPPPPQIMSPPAPLAPETAAPPPSPVSQESIISRYIGQVRAIIDSNLVVPQELIDSGSSGDCVLEFTLGPDGKLLSASIVTRSFIQPVNEAAMDALRASHLPAFLPGMDQAPHSFTLPVHESGST
ncbi:MAG: hypothetical protein B7Z71_02010 [Acidocella sp. 21-58-7]|nr:MAG: hypothetical protein B7Z71_02010 [Acidocella sp. 21-58-7]